MKKENWSRVLFYCTNMVVFILIIAMDALFPYAIDDLSYSGGVHTRDFYYALTLSLEKISAFYFTWSGRIIGIFLLFLCPLWTNLCTMFVMLSCMSFCVI